MRTFQLALLFTTLYFFNASAQNYGCDLLEDPDVILQGDASIPEVLMVGTFHFAYYGLDAHVTKEDDQVNVLLPERQKEMKELVKYIAKFKPTKIMVESGPNTGYLMEDYRAYQKDRKSAKAKEIHQIVFPLMKKFGIDTLYGVDARSLSRELGNHKDSSALHPILNEIFDDYNYSNEDPVYMRYKEWYKRDDKLTLNNDLLTYFKHMNSDKVLERGWGAYLCGDFKNNGHKGSDAMMINWYSRNLRIFRNIQDLTEPDDRILILYGAGHMTILKQLYEASAEYELVKFGEVDKKCKKQLAKR